MVWLEYVDGIPVMLHVCHIGTEENPVAIDVEPLTEDYDVEGFDPDYTFTTDGSKLVVFYVGTDENVKVCDPRSGQVTCTISLDGSSLYSLRLNQAGTRVIINREVFSGVGQPLQHVIEIWDIETENRLYVKHLNSPSDGQVQRVHFAQTGFVGSTSDGLIVFKINSDVYHIVVDADTNHETTRMVDNGPLVDHIYWMPNGRDITIDYEVPDQLRREFKVLDAGTLTFRFNLTTSMDLSCFPVVETYSTRWFAIWERFDAQSRSYVVRVYDADTGNLVSDLSFPFTYTNDCAKRSGVCEIQVWQHPLGTMDVEHITLLSTGQLFIGLRNESIVIVTPSMFMMRCVCSSWSKLLQPHP